MVEQISGVLFEIYSSYGTRMMVPGLGRFECGVGFIHQRCEIFVGVALSPQQDDCQLQPGDILLVWDAFVRGYEDLELVLGEPQKLAVLFAGPSGFGHRNDFVLFRKVNLEAAVHVLV